MINIKAIRNNIGANALNVVLNAFFQLISVPIFLKYWGVDLYGEWLVLISLTAYFAMSDIGLNTVTINEFSIAYARKQYDRCNVLFNNTLFFILSVFVFSLVITFIFCFLFNISQIFKFSLISEATSELIIICLIIQVFSGMVSGLFDSIYRATDKNARAIMINNYIRLAENIILILGIIIGLEIHVLILFYIAPKLLGLFYKSFKSRNYFSLKIGFQYFELFEFKKIIIPAFSFLSFPVGNSIILQGFTLLINFTLGSTAVVLYNTTRTLINFVKTGLTLINSSIWPEFSLAFGRNDFNVMKKLHRVSVASSFYFSLVACFLFFLLGEPIYLFWIKNKIEFNQILFYCFLITLISNTVWYTSSVVLASTNKHKAFSLYYLIACCLSIISGYIIIKVTSVITFVPLALLVIDVFLILIVLKQSFKIVHDRFDVFFKYLINFPFSIFGEIKSRLLKK